MGTKRDRSRDMTAARTLLEVGGFVMRASTGSAARALAGSPLLSFPGTDLRAVVGRATTALYRVGTGQGRAVDVAAEVDTRDLAALREALVGLGLEVFAEPMRRAAR